LTGEEYLFSAPAPCGSLPSEEVVRFIGFTTCISAVVVLDRQGRRMLVDRTRLFKMAGKE
jgi:hypothetical protein